MATHRSVRRVRQFLKSGYRAAGDVDLSTRRVKHGTPFVLFPRGKGPRVGMAGEVISGKQ